METKILMEIKINDDKQLLYKLNEISERFNLSLDEVVEVAINKLSYDVDFIQTLRT
ncbi:hypothetical protein [Clostridium butyricum]